MKENAEGNGTSGLPTTVASFESPITTLQSYEWKAEKAIQAFSGTRQRHGMDETTERETTVSPQLSGVEHRRDANAKVVVLGRPAHLALDHIAVVG